MNRTSEPSRHSFSRASPATTTKSASVELAAIVVAVNHGNGQVTYHHRFGPKQPSPHAGNGLLEQALDNSRRHFRGEFNRPGQ